ncbi:protein kinase [Strepomyces sp. STD 3.1]|nr:protein kinase [Streptomyces sp. STD 3.1]
MDDYAGRVLADRYRLPLPPSDEYELTESRAFDTYSGQEVLVRQVPLPEVVEAEVLDADGLPDGFTSRDGGVRHPGRRTSGGSTGIRRPADPVVRRAVEAAQAAAAVPDHPRLDQVFDVFAEGGSLWIVSELVAARPLAALLAEQTLTPYRAAEVASDILLALRVLHTYGWVHRNITARTVLVCDDGRVMLTGLAVGAAEEALCGYDPVPPPDEDPAPGPLDPGGTFGPGGGVPGPGGAGPGTPGPVGARAGILGSGDSGILGPGGADPEAARRAAIEARGVGGLPVPGAVGPGAPAGLAPAQLDTSGDIRAARAGAIAAYRAGARAAARVQEAQNGRAALPGARPAPDEAGAPAPHQGPGTGRPGQDPGHPGLGAPYALGTDRPPHPPAPAAGEEPPPRFEGSGYGVNSSGQGAEGQGAEDHEPRREADPGWSSRATGPGSPYGTDPADRPAEDTPPGRIADPYGVRATAWHGATPRTGGDPASAPPRFGGDPAAPAPRLGGDPASAPPGFGGDPAAPAPRLGGDPASGPPGFGGDPAAPAPRLPGDPASAPPRFGGDSASAPPRFGGDPATPAPRLPGDPAPHAPRTPGDPAAPGRALPPAPRQADTAGYTVPPQEGGPVASGRWDDLVARTAAPRGPATALAAERARQTRMAVVGPVTERWAPEQAGPVHENWQLAAPIGPATDLWALGALLYRAVQGHAPYPEESTAELVQIVCAEPPAFAEECGPLRPVVESLLRQDPTERIDFEELRGWLRSLVRSAPEPEAGLHVISAPPAETGHSRLPIVRRRGELVRRRRAGLPAHHGRHKRGRAEPARSPRSLGRTLLLLILLALAGAIAYAMFFLPKSDTRDSGAADRTGTAGDASQAPPAGSPDVSSEPRPEQTSPDSTPGGSETDGGSTETQSNVADGFTLRKDPEGFRVAVAEDWDRTPRNGSGQVVYSKGDFELLVVPGRDRTSEFGDDPMVYQRDSEPELASYRASSWATSNGLKTIEVGGRTMAEGQFTWTGAGGELFVRNVAILIDGRYHVVQVRGPEAERDEVSRLFEQASATYQYTR